MRKLKEFVERVDKVLLETPEHNRVDEHEALLQEIVYIYLETTN